MVNMLTQSVYLDSIPVMNEKNQTSSHTPNEHSPHLGQGSYGCGETL